MPVSRLTSTPQAPTHHRTQATTASVHHRTTTTHRTASADVFETSSTGASATQRRLAADARHVALGMGGYHGHGKCATGVERAVASSMHQIVHGNGNTIGNSLVEHGFHEVHMSLADALKQPGLVLTWQHTQTRLGHKYGHTAVTLGDGHSSASDFVERDTIGGSVGRTGLRIYAPDA